MRDTFLNEIETESDVQQNVQVIEQLNVQETDAAIHAPYTAVQLSEQLGVSDATIRNRWFNWLLKVAPEPLLREGKGYSELARSLFLEFKDIPQNKRDEWVRDAKARYSQEWSSAGIIEGELVPAEVGGALATLKQGNVNLAELLAQEMDEAIAFSGQLEDIEADFSVAELEEMKIQGALRGVKRYKIMKQAEIKTFTELRQRGTQSE